MCVGLLGGMSTPWIRGMECLLGAWSALALLVARVAADDVQLALAPHQLAVLADTLHTGTNFHRPPPGGFGPGAGGETIFLAGSERTGKGEKTGGGPFRYKTCIPPRGFAPAQTGEQPLTAARGLPFSATPPGRDRGRRPRPSSGPASPRWCRPSPRTAAPSSDRTRQHAPGRTRCSCPGRWPGPAPSRSRPGVGAVLRSARSWSPPPLLSYPAATRPRKAQPLDGAARRCDNPRRLVNRPGSVRFLSLIDRSTRMATATPAKARTV